MSVVTETNRVIYDCNGSVTEFAFPYALFSSSDLRVYLTDETTGVITLLVENTAYTVKATNNAYENGCTVTTVLTYGSNYKLTLIRDLAATQSLDLVENDAMPAESLEDALDRATILIQQLKDLLDRTPVVPVDEEGVALEIPSVLLRKGKYLYFDASSGAVSAAEQLATGSATISAFAETLLDDASAIAALGTLGAVSNLTPYIIAANDSPSAWKTIAATTLGPTGDLSAAITAALGSGHSVIKLAPGTFLWSTLLTLGVADSLFLRGSGRSTVIDLDSPTATADNQTIMIQIPASYTGALRVGDFKLDATGMTNTAYSMFTIWDSDEVYVPEFQNDQCWENIYIDISNMTATGGQTQIGHRLQNVRNVTVYGDTLGPGSSGQIRVFRYCNNLANVRVITKNVSSSATGSVACFSGGKRIIGCRVIATNLSGQGGPANYFSGLSDMSACFVLSDGSAGLDDTAFSSCERLSCCHAQSVKGRGFSYCNFVSACHANGCGSDGFSTCTYVTSSEADGCGGSGFVDCEHVAACLSQGNTVSGFSTCKQVQQCYAHTNTSNQYGSGGTQSYADQASNACANTAAGGYNR